MLPKEHYDNFFEDVFVECEDKYGQVVETTKNADKVKNSFDKVEEMNVCDNLGDHLVTIRSCKMNIEPILRRLSNQVGNVYVKFKKEEDAEKAVNDLNNRWFGGRCVATL